MNYNAPLSVNLRLMKEQDYLQRFIFEQLGLRGEWVRLHKSWEDCRRNLGFASSDVEALFGQAMAASVLLSATIKFNGSLILQAQGEGALKAVVAQCTHDKKIRGWVRNDKEVPKGNIQQMLGQGHLAITIESDIADPYQGIVSLDEKTLSENLQNYFTQSEQLNTRLWLFADKHFAAGLLLQEVPDRKLSPLDWERISILADTVTQEEMMTLDSEEMLYRLFNEEEVKVYDPEAVQFGCTCSRQKTASTLLALGRSELELILSEQDLISVGCQFCGEQFEFDKVDVENLLQNPDAGFPGSTSRH